MKGLNNVILLGWEKKAVKLIRKKCTSNRQKKKKLRVCFKKKVLNCGQRLQGEAMKKGGEGGVSFLPQSQAKTLHLLTILWFRIILSNSSLIFLYFSSVWGVRTYEASGSGLSQPLCSFLLSACSEHQHKKRDQHKKAGRKQYLHHSACTLNHSLRLVCRNGRPWGDCDRNSHLDRDWHSQ